MQGTGIHGVRHVWLGLDDCQGWHGCGRTNKQEDMWPLEKHDPCISAHFVVYGPTE